MFSYRQIHHIRAVFFFILAIVLETSLIYGQSGKTITVKAGEDIAKAYSPNGFYRFPQFSKAVLFRRGAKENSNLLLNYDIYAAAIQFINERGDTLKLINPSFFDSISIEENIFYYVDGYLELVASSYPVRLVKRTRIKMQPQTIGAYGTTNSAAAIDKISSYSIGGNSYSFTLNENMMVKESISLFFMDTTGKLMKATKANLLLLVPADKQEKLKLYLQQNKTGFEKEADMKKLLEAL